MCIVHPPLGIVIKCNLKCFFFYVEKKTMRFPTLSGTMFLPCHEQRNYNNFLKFQSAAHVFQVSTCVISWLKLIFLQHRKTHSSHLQRPKKLATKYMACRVRSRQVTSTEIITAISRQTTSLGTWVTPQETRGCLINVFSRLW